MVENVADNNSQARAERGKPADPELCLAATVAGRVPDPEIPHVTIADLGIVRDVSRDADGTIRIGLTPTYSGCPAVLAIEMAVETELLRAGIRARVHRVISPAWTTDWITSEGREKLRLAGIAPPVGRTDERVAFFSEPTVPCPRCTSTHTSRIAEFGSTACKAHYRCNKCSEPFEYFKCL